MQDRYVGDVGDFGKYGLLRHLVRTTSLRLGVNWYLVPDEPETADGRHIGYLDDRKENRDLFRKCDPQLWDALGKIVREKDRRVVRIQEDEILPKETLFYARRLEWPVSTDARSARGRDERSKHREAWARGAFSELRGSQVVFLDPDNGLQVKSVSLVSSKGLKFIFMGRRETDELRPLYSNGQSLVIYQHLNRSCKTNEQVKHRLRQVKEAIGASYPFALIYHRGSARAFIVAPTAPLRDCFNRWVGLFIESAWKAHFSVIP